MDINTIIFDEKGLVPAIAQDYQTGEILMLAWMNRISLEQTLKTGIMTYWSRSRKELWVKGKTSGNFQEVKEVFVDCDADCLLFKIEQKGNGAACHAGYRSCFYRKIDAESGEFSIIAEKVYEP